MEFNKLPLLTLMAKRMAWLGQRQKVLAQNIANANTGGYEARDLEPMKFKDMVQSASGGGKLQMATTSVGHIVPRGAKAPAAKEVVTDAAANLSGNTVDVEKEVMKVGQTSMDYQFITHLYRKQVAMIKMAIGRGGL